MKRENPYLDVPTIPDVPTLDINSFLNTNKRDIELEIGFGKGHFLLERAAVVQDAILFGIETRRKWVHLVQSRIAKRKTENVVIGHGNAVEVFNRLRPSASVRRIFINFPDPWWKARHEKRMVICPRLVSEAARLLKDGGEIFVQTDVDFRAERYRTVLDACNLLTPAYPDRASVENCFDAHSLREKRCNEIGLPVFRLLYRRTPDNGQQ
jgi:tRNA (guanine-N7-)-methyltransferase